MARTACRSTAYVPRTRWDSCAAVRRRSATSAACCSGGQPLSGCTKNRSGIETVAMTPMIGQACESRLALSAPVPLSGQGITGCRAPTCSHKRRMRQFVDKPRCALPVAGCRRIEHLFYRWFDGGDQLSGIAMSTSPVGFPSVQLTHSIRCAEGPGASGSGMSCPPAPRACAASACWAAC